MKKDRQTRRSSPTPAAEGREAVDGTRFTQRARTALTLAQACAAELGHSYVGSEHLPFLELNYYITSVLGKQVSKRNFSSPYM